MKKYYIPTPTDFKIMKACMKVGFKVYPDMPIWNKRKPLVRLAYVQWRGKPVISEREPFDQAYWTFAVMNLYRRIYKTYVQKLTKKIEEVKLPPRPSELPPPPPNS